MVQLMHGSVNAWISLCMDQLMHSSVNAWIS